MREQFSDLYNVVTVQCEYFGSRFMQNTTNISFPDGLKSISDYISLEDLELIKQD